MRVIGGFAKGRRLKAPLGKAILRPTSDQVREAIFDIIGPEIENQRFLDLFSGTGAVGIEALSRGAQNATFIDDRTASIDLIKTNLMRCGFQKNFEIIQCDALQTIMTLSNRQRRFEFIFLDPPYNTDLAVKTLEVLSNSGLLLPSTSVLAEHLVKRPMPEGVSGLIKRKEHTFGDTMISRYGCIET